MEVTVALLDTCGTYVTADDVNGSSLIYHRWGFKSVLEKVCNIALNSIIIFQFSDERLLFGAYAASGAVIHCYTNIRTQNRLILRTTFSSLALSLHCFGKSHNLKQ